MAIGGVNPSPLMRPWVDLDHALGTTTPGACVYDQNHSDNTEFPMGLTVEVLNDLEARNLQAAAQAALVENNAIALIELLEMLWSCDLEGANTVIDAVLQRLQQLRALR